MPRTVSRSWTRLTRARILAAGPASANAPQISLAERHIVQLY